MIKRLALCTLLSLFARQGFAYDPGTPPIANQLNQIAVTTVSASSVGILFTNLPTIYNTVFLNCQGLTLSSTSNSFLIQVGEGGTPTWETGAHYSFENWFSLAATTITAQKGTTATDLVNGIGVGSTTVPTSIKLYLDSFASATVNKQATLTVAAPASGGETYLTGVGYWNNDTTAITGIQVVPSAGTMSGTCALYGIK